MQRGKPEHEAFLHCAWLPNWALNSEVTCCPLATGFSKALIMSKCSQVGRVTPAIFLRDIENGGCNPPYTKLRSNPSGQSLFITRHHWPSTEGGARFMSYPNRPFLQIQHPGPIRFKITGGG